VSVADVGMTATPLFPAPLINRLKSRRAESDPHIHPMKKIPCTIGSSALLLAGGLYAQNIWNGAGVTGGTAGTDWTAAANYTATPTFSSSTDLKFSTITNAAGGVTLTAGTGGTYAVKDLYFADVTTLGAGQVEAQNIVLNGNGTAGQTTLDLAGNIFVPSFATSKVTLGADLTLNLSNAGHQINFKVNNNVTTQQNPTAVAVIHSLITGGGTGATLTARFSGYGNGVSGSAAMVFTNNSNSFVAVQNRFDNYVGFTSIKNVGEGGSAMGNATTVATGTISLGNGGYLNYLGTGDQTTDRNIVGGSTNTYGNASAGTTITYNGSMTYGGPTSFGYGIRANVISGATLVINSDIADNATASSPNASISKQGSSTYYDTSGNIATNDGGGTLVLGGNNSFSGAVTVSAGTVKIAHVNALGNTTGTTTVSNGATLDLNGVSGVAEAVSVRGTGAGANGALVNTNASAKAGLTGNVTLVADASVGGAGDLVLDGVILGGSFKLTKVGAGELTLNGVNTYTGLTTVSQGALGGKGTVAGAATFATGTTLNPGDGTTTGQLTFGGNLTLGNDAIFSVALNQAAGTDYDRVAVTGTSTITGSILSLGFGADFSSSAVTGQTFTILSSSGTLTGQFDQGASITATSGVFTYDFGISYTGNAITLTLNTISSVPEPSSWALILGAASLGVVGLRRRRRC
jgi:autotransporter-associated beta strand protein